MSRLTSVSSRAAIPPTSWTTTDQSKLYGRIPCHPAVISLPRPPDRCKCRRTCHCHNVRSIPGISTSFTTCCKGRNECPCVAAERGCRGRCTGCLSTEKSGFSGNNQFRRNIVDIEKADVKVCFHHKTIHCRPIICS